MRLATIQTANGPRAAVLHGEHYVDLHATDATFPVSVRELLERGPSALKAAGEAARRPNAIQLPAADAKLLAPVPDPHKIVCIGLNYKDHAAEGGVPIPREPVLFSKYATALIGHGANIVLPSVSKKVDYEAELVIVVGRRGRHLKAESAAEYAAGHTIGHD